MSAASDPAARSDARLRAMKEPLTPLAGPYGHPFHAMTVTVPIGSWVASGIFDVVSMSSQEPRVWSRGSSALLKLGIVSALGASAFGFMDYLKVPSDSKVGATATTHLALNLGVLGLVALNVVERDRRAAREPQSAVSGGEFGLSLLSLGLLGASGWLGGELAYHFGVRVADEGTQASGLPGA